MKITKSIAKHFEWEQKEFGTVVALSNFVITVITHLLKDIGVKGIKLSYYKEEKEK